MRLSGQFSKSVNIVKTKITLLLAMLAVLSVFAQTARESIGLGGGASPPPSPYIAPQPPAQPQVAWNPLRLVNGQLYDATRSKLWSAIYGKVDHMEGGVLIIYQDHDMYARNISPIYTAVTNYTTEAFADQKTGFHAMQVGTYHDAGGRPIPLYDCGTPYTLPPPTPEQIQAAQDAARLAAQRQKERRFLVESNAVRWLQPQASNGDAGAQCDLGEHYLNGVGCETNRQQAVYWLTQAADQGDFEASNKLANLKK